MNSQDKAYPLVSVIVPTYDNEARIARTLESIIAQDYPNLEVIVVNDASKDATEDVAHRVLGEWGGQFQVLASPINIGQSSARNMGLDAAKGEYVIFFDHDDLAEKNFVSTLADLAIKHNCDISFCGMKDRFDDGRPDVEWPISLDVPYVRSGEELIRLRLVKRIVPGAWCMLFRKKFLDETGIRFYDGCHWGEDIEIQLKVFCRAKNIAFSPECLYIYIHHPAMSSLRDTNTEGKKLIRYREGTETNFRIAKYLSEYAPSEKVKDLAENLLLPEAIERRATLCAKTDDRAAFDALLADKTTRRILQRSRKCFFKKPEIFLKAFVLLCFPNLYYRMRGAHFKKSKTN